jgi:hypothetical protein
MRLIDPQHGPLTPAERQRRRRARIGPKTLNRIRRRKWRAKRAAERKTERAVSRANGAQRTATKHAVAAATIAALGETIKRLSGAQVPRRGIPTADSLAGYTVETIEQHDALALVLQHEWLGNIGNSTRTHRYAVLAPGKDAGNPGNWQTTRALWTDGRHLSFAEAREAGWQIASREAKHVYATCIGRERKAWLRSLVALPYPKPDSP